MLLRAKNLLRTVTMRKRFPCVTTYILQLHDVHAETGSESSNSLPKYPDKGKVGLHICLSTGREVLATT